MDTTFYPAAWVAVQIDQKIVAFILFLFEVVASFQSQTSFIFGLKVYASDSLSIHDCIFGAHVY